MSSVPPATTTFLPSAIWLDCCSTAEPAATVRLPAIEFAPVVFRLSVPALTVVIPVYVFAPLRVAMPAPVLLIPKTLPPSLMTPDSVSCVPSTATVLVAPNVTAPAKVLVPVLVASVPPFTVTASAVV